jgi:guanylate kinase
MRYKPIIFCIVGESGSGKTMVVEAIEKYAGVKMIQSYTDRPRRHPNENGHTFLEKADFDLLKKEDMIAFTKWGDHRYCCLTSDVGPVNTYVIDCNGLVMLRRDHGDKYIIVAIRLKRSEAERVEAVGADRVARDAGRFYLSDEAFDKVFYNELGTKLDIIADVWAYMREIIERNAELSDGGGYFEKWYNM